jgi:hypothetical protein
MKHVISVGGGIASTWLLVDKVLAKYPREDVTAVICEVKNDHADMWRLIAAVEKQYDISIKRVGLGVDIWDIFFYTGMMGNPFADPCSRLLKREAMSNYMTANFNPFNTVLHVGITAGEIDRMMAIKANWTRKGWQVEADLADMPEIPRQELLAMCEQQFGFVPLLYRQGMKHNNCSGFCVKAGKAQMARLLFHSRALYLEHERMELLHQQTFNHQHTIMRDEWTRNGKRGADTLTLRAFRERMETKWSTMLPSFNPFDGLEETPACVFCEST